MEIAVNNAPVVSRDAQMLAMCLFAFGEKASVNFKSPHRISPRAKAALDELVGLGHARRIVGYAPAGLGVL
jgi:hypothetical protein